MPVRERQAIRFGPFEFDSQSGELFKNSLKLKLEGQPLQVLAILLEKPGMLVTREEICNRLWPADTFVDSEHILNAHIWKLRQALGDSAETPKYIETLPKRGYRFVFELGKQNEERQVPKRRAEGALPSQQIVVVAPVQIQPRVHSYRLWMAFIAALAFIIPSLLTLRSILRSQPRIVSTRQLTHTGFQKSRGEPYFCYLATDGSRLYFHENRMGDKWVLSQVSVAGGEISDIPVDLKNTQCLQELSPSGTELLVSDCCPGWEYWGVPVPAGPAHRVPIPSGSPWAVWSMSGKHLFYTPEVNKALFRIDSDGNNQKQLFSGVDVTYPRTSPDGRKIRFSAFSGFEGARRDIMEVSTDGGTPRMVFPELRGKTYFGDWTPDGKLFFFYRQEGGSSSLWAIREDGYFGIRPGKPSLLYAGPLRLQSAVSSKDGRELYVIGAALRGELSVYDPNRASFVPYLGGISACYVTFSPDRQWVAYVSYPDGALWRSRVDGTLQMQLTFPPMRVLLPRWSPDGKLIAFMEASSSDHYSVYYVQASGGQPRLLLAGPSEPAYPTWSPDGRYLAYGDLDLSVPITQLQILDLETMQSIKVPDSIGKVSPRWSPNGKYLAALMGERELALYNFEEKRWRKLPAGNGLIWPTWSHDSRFIYAYREGNIFRIDPSTNKIENIASLKSISWTTFRSRWYGWFDLTPDDQVMILRNIGTEEIFALQLQY